jgi:hypothetical protein
MRCQSRNVEVNSYIARQMKAWQGRSRLALPHQGDMRVHHGGRASERPVCDHASSSWLGRLSTAWKAFAASSGRRLIVHAILSGESSAVEKLV